MRLASDGPCGANGALSGSTSLTCTYNTVGSDTFTVPEGVDAVEVVVTGAQGGRYFIAGDAAHGGSPAGDITGLPRSYGGQSAGILTDLPAGAVLQVNVAGKGADGTAASRSGGMQNGPSGGQGALGGFGGSTGGVPGGPSDASGADGGTAFNGGNGSGGGSSDVRLGPGCATLSCSLADCLLVGSGGGGGGGTGGQGNALGGAGGDGGGTVGADGPSAVAGGNAGVPGTGVTQTAGGPGADQTDPRFGHHGSDGAGGAGNLPCNPPPAAGCGGANGLTSGGGAGGGGGGGSSYAAPSVSSSVLTAGRSPRSRPSPRCPPRPGRRLPLMSKSSSPGAPRTAPTATSG